VLWTEACDVHQTFVKAGKVRVPKAGEAFKKTFEARCAALKAPAL
jgi:predicted nucleic acid-binding Zn ribbon protein